MSGEAIGWDKPQRVTIGVPSRIVSGIMDEWLYRAAPVARKTHAARYSRAGASSKRRARRKWT